MRPQDAQKIGEQLSAYLDGELSDDERDAVEALLEGDAEARALLAELRDASGAVRSLPRDRAPASILEQINARLERSELLGPAERKVTLARHKRRPIRSTLAMAASLLFVVTGGLWIYFRVADTQDSTPQKLAMGDRAPSPAPEKNMPALQDELRRLSGRISDRGYAPAPSEEDAERLSSLGYMAEGTRSQPESTLVSRSISHDKDSPAQSVTRDEPVIDTVNSKGTLVGLPVRDLDNRLGKEVAGAGRPGINESATLEQKLAAGDGLEVVATHRFDAEPVQLQLVVDSRYRSQLESTLETVLAGSGAVPLDSLEVAASTASLEPTTVAFYQQGSPGENYAPGAEPQKQILARVSPRAIERILQTAAAQDDALKNVRFGVGRMSAEGVEESMRIARLVIPADAYADETMLGESAGFGGFGGGGRFGDAGFRAGRAGQEVKDGAAYADNDSAESKSEMTGPPSDPAELLAWLLDVPRAPAANSDEPGEAQDAVAQAPATERYKREAVAKSSGQSDDAPGESDTAEKELSDSVPARRARQVGAKEAPATTQPAEESFEPLAAGSALATKSDLGTPATQPADIDGDGFSDAEEWPLYTIVIQIIEKVAEPASPVPQSQPTRE